MGDPEDKFPPVGVPEEFDESTSVMAPFSAGSFFGDRFRIDEALGTGGMGAVFRATDLLSDEPVALKVLLKTRQDGEARQRFAREAEILSKLSHPGIVGIRGFGHAQGRVPWLAMEFVDGRSLGERIRKGPPLDVDELAPILRGLCEALHTAHNAGVVHRDLKPENVILVEREGALTGVKVIDFGLSRLDESKKLTKTGTLLGTPRYMAPEQIASIKSSSPRSDIYALGVLLFEALTGHSPFTASDQGQLLGAILQGRIDRIGQHRQGLPPEFDAVVRRAMDKDPDQRFQTPLELASAFEEAAGIRSSQISFSKAPPAQKGRSRATMYGTVVVAGLVAGVLAAALTYWLVR